MESPKDNYQQLGFTDLVNADLLAHSTEEKYGMHCTYICSICTLRQ
jgi:hypothetical protein